MSKKFFGIVDETVRFANLGDLTLHRSVGAIPFAGRYRLIDFPLSCFRHANVTNVAIYTRGKFRSLQDHLGNGKNWDLNRKRDGLFFLPKIEQPNYESKILSFDHIKEHIEYLLKSKEEYVLITNTYVITVFDYEDLINFHISKNGDITEVYHNNERLNIFVLSRKLLIELVLESTSIGYTNMVEVIDLANSYKVARYDLEGYVRIIRSLNDYYSANMEMLDQGIYRSLFTKEHPIITKTTTSPSTHYKPGAKAKNSILANGIITEGTVENSVIFRSVIIGKNAYIKNSIIHQRCVIGDNCIIENAILDKECVIASNVVVKGEMNKPLLLKKHTKMADYNL